MADSHAPLLIMNQLFVYLRDHLLISTACRYRIIKSFLPANQCWHGHFTFIRAILLATPARPDPPFSFSDSRLSYV